MLLELGLFLPHTIPTDTTVCEYLTSSIGFVNHMKKLSIFETLKDKVGDEIPVISLTKATLVHLSHTLEDFVLRRQLPAFIFTGFQESSHWRKETERYQKLADTAMQVCIFAGKPLPEDSNSEAVQIELEGDDPLRQEWFLGIFSTEFSVILCGLDNLTATSRRSTPPI